MPVSPSDSMMSGSPQRLQIISTEPTTTPQRIQVHYQHHLFLCFQYFKYTKACQCSPWYLLFLTPSDCNWPADGSEDPDSDSDEAASSSQTAVHSNHGWQRRVRQGPPDLIGHTQHQAAHLHCCWQPDTWKDTGCHHTTVHYINLLLTVYLHIDFMLSHSILWYDFWQLFNNIGDMVILQRHDF